MASPIAHLVSVATLVMALVVAGPACSDSAPSECLIDVPIVEPRGFRILPAAEDPLELDAGVPDTGTATTSSTALVRGRCEAEATTVEDLGTTATFSIVTRDCSRLTVTAPLMREVEAGENVELRIWHFPLLPYGPAEATLRVGLEGEWLWTQVVAIPSQSKLLEGRFTPTHRVAVGGSLEWHVSNHGVNSWNWVSASVKRTGPCPSDGGP